MFTKRSVNYFCLLSAVSFAEAGNLFGNNGQGNGNAPTTVGETKCTLYRIEPLMVDLSDEEVTSKVCVMDAAYEAGITGISYELDESTFPYGWDKDVEWSETVMTISQASVKKDRGKHGGGVISVVPGATIKKEKKEKKEKALRGGRQLSPKTGQSTLIVLYAIPPDIKNHQSSAAMADDIFGINVTNPAAADTNNVVVQMNACSRGQLTYVPACAAGQACFGQTPIVNGVLEVPITEPVANVDSGTVVNWVTAAANLLLQGTGVNVDSFTQQMVIAPDGVSWGGAAAWAYLPGTLSAFQSTYATHMGVQMHEFGHNIGLHHSGYDGAAYGDKSCLMGATSYGDDGPKICWNAAKSWTTGWYTSDSVTVNPAAGASNLFTLVGVDDWSKNIYTPGQHRVVLQILDSSISQDFYVIYNRAKGMNDGVLQTNFAPNQVTVSTGFGTEVSWHQAGLSGPNQAANSFPRFRKPNYNGGVKDLVVKVCGMTAGTQGSTPDTASVLVYLDDGPGLNNGPVCPGEVACVNDSQCDDGNFCTLNTCNLATNTCIPPVDISASRCPTCGALTYCNPNGFCDKVCDDQKTCTNDYCQADVCQHDPLAGCTRPGALLETWMGLSGSAVSDLTSSFAYKNDPPNEVKVVTKRLNTTRDRADNFGARLQTYIIPKVTGTYNFWVASDDSSELWISTDDNEANLVKIASVSGYTSYEQWNKYSSQKSPGISLVAGQPYFMMALNKEGGGGDHLSIAWQSSSVPFTVIDGSEFYLEPPIACSADSECTDWRTNPCETRSCNLAWGFCDITPIDGCENGALFQVWHGISGTSVNNLLADPRYPNLPNTTQVLTKELEAPTNIGSNFGGRLQTYVMPPKTCDYTFYIASDDNGSLNLSTDSNPANAKLIASIGGWAGVRDWFKYASQKSAPQSLVKGQIYYLEAIYKEGGGGDNLAIAWECTEHNIPLQVIPAEYTSLSWSAPEPTASPSSKPTSVPTTPPTDSPTPSPTTSPTKAPTKFPTSSPTAPTRSPTNQPTDLPTSPPTNQPSLSPSKAPTPVPSTDSPTSNPTTADPTKAPTDQPSNAPTRAPTNQPTDVPTQAPTALTGFCTDGTGRCLPTNMSQCACAAKSEQAPEGIFGRRDLQSCIGLKAKDCNAPACQWAGGNGCIPASAPNTSQPTNAPTPNPTNPPVSSAPTPSPSRGPTNSPVTDTPSKSPTDSPTQQPFTSSPTQTFTCGCSITAMPTAAPTSAPTNEPTSNPTNAPTARPTDQPTNVLTANPTSQPVTSSPTTPCLPTNTACNQSTTCIVSEANCCSECCNGIGAFNSGSKGLKYCAP